MHGVGRSRLRRPRGCIQRLSPAWRHARERGHAAHNRAEQAARDGQFPAGTAPTTQRGDSIPIVILTCGFVVSDCYRETPGTRPARPSTSTGSPAVTTLLRSGHAADPRSRQAALRRRFLDFWRAAGGSRAAFRPSRAIRGTAGPAFRRADRHCTGINWAQKTGFERCRGGRYSA